MEEWNLEGNNRLCIELEQAIAKIFRRDENDLTIEFYVSFI